MHLTDTRVGTSGISTSAAPRGGLRRNPLVRLFSSVALGITLLSLILIYASVFSALAPLRGIIEVSEMEIFRHWVFVALVVLFCVNLSVATWTRIRWNLTNLGVLTVHTGLLLLVGGSVWYFGTKVEGDILVQMPRVELVSLRDASRASIVDIPAEKGKSWSQQVPVLGGNVVVQVDDVRLDENESVAGVRLQYQAGSAPPQHVELTNERPMQALNDLLAVRLRTFPPTVLFYDDEKPALLWRKSGSDEQGIVPVAGLPMHRERYLDEGYELRQRDGPGSPAPSKRTWAHVNLFGLQIPTGWFEHWRMPIALQTPGLPFDVSITGYVPYATEWRARAVSSNDSADGPAINFAITGADRPIRDALFAKLPAMSLSRFAPVEFRWVGGAAGRDALLTPIAGEHELTITLRDPPLTQTLAVTPGQTIQLPGTTYELQVQSFDPMWQLASPALRGAVSPAATIQVTNGQQRFRRTVLQRFPESSQDVDESGQRHSEGPLDANLVLRYRSAGEGWLMVVAGPDIEPALGLWHPDGRLDRQTLRPGAPASLGGGMAFVLEESLPAARLVEQPLVEPIAGREPGAERQLSAVRLNFRGRERFAGWSESVWVPFTMYADLDLRPRYPIRSVQIQPPGTRERWEFLYTRTPRLLGAGLIGTRLTVDFFPGRVSPERWFSDVVVVPQERVRGAEDLRLPKVSGSSSEPHVRHEHVFTNRTGVVAGWTLFQSNADFQDHWKYTVLGVGNRQGMWPMIIGSILIPLGCLYAFYVKPVLIRRRRSAALAAAAGRLAGSPAASVS